MVCSRGFALWAGLWGVVCSEAAEPSLGISSGDACVGLCSHPGPSVPGGRSQVGFQLALQAGSILLPPLPPCSLQSE